MPITTSVPSTVRRPGNFQQLDGSQAARGVNPVNRRIALVGAKLAAGTQPTLTPIQIFTEFDGDTWFGAGSELALMIRAAIKQGAKMGKSPAIFAAAVADPGGGTKATRTFTVTVTTALAGTLIVTIAGRAISVGVAAADPQNTIAANLAAAINALAKFLPVTAGVAANVVTCTANNAGVNGLDLKTSLLQAPIGVSVALASPVAGAGAYDITPALDTLIDKTYHAIAVANHTSTDVTKLATHAAQVNDPQIVRFGYGILAETGTLSTGTTLSGAPNNPAITVITAEDFPAMTGELAAEMAVTYEGEEKTQRDFDGVQVDTYLPPAASVYTASETEAALAAGATPLSVDDHGNVYIVRAVTTQIAVNGASTDAFLDINVIRTWYDLASGFKDECAIAFNRENADPATLERVWTVAYNFLKKREEIGQVINVDQHKAEIVVEQDVSVPTRFNVALPEAINPALHQIVGKHTLLVDVNRPVTG